MRAKPMMLMIVALGCGLVASVSVSQYLESSGAGKGPALEMVKIYVAATDINIGDKLDANSVKLSEWPKDRVPEGAILTFEELNEKYPSTRLYPEEPILKSKLMDRVNSPNTKIPDGFRVVSVKVDIEAGLAGLVQPGDRVDLVLVVRKSAESPETLAKTILKDVNVFAVDAATERSVDKDGRAVTAKTVSLLVKPPQVETVILASEMGKLQLSLRRPNDSLEDDTPGATVSEVLGKKSERTEDRRQKSGDGDSFVKWLADMGKANVAPQPPAPIEEKTDSTQPAKPWTMVMVTPSGNREFEWPDERKLPREVGQGPNNGNSGVTGFQSNTPSSSNSRPSGASRERVDRTNMDRLGGDRALNERAGSERAAGDRSDKNLERSEKSTERGGERSADRSRPSKSRTSNSSEDGMPNEKLETGRRAITDEL